MSPEELQRWVPLSRAADLMGLKVKTAQRRLDKLNAAVGGGIVRRLTRNGHRQINVDALLHHLRHDAKERDEEVELLQARVNDLETRLTALRNAHAAFRRKAHAWFARHEKRT